MLYFPQIITQTACSFSKSLLNTIWIREDGVEWPARDQVGYASLAVREKRQLRSAGGQGSRRLEHRAKRPGESRLGGSDAVECKVAKRVKMGGGIGEWGESDPVIVNVGAKCLNLNLMTMRCCNCGDWP